MRKMEWTMAAQAPMTEATYYILLALMKPGHGYGMMQRIKELSGGRIEMGPGTLYGVLTRMNKEGLITLTSEEAPPEELRYHRRRKKRASFRV